MSRRKRDRKSLARAAAAAGTADGGREPGPADERDDGLQRLRAKVGEITMNNELLLERCHRLEANLPLPRRRPSE
jgi:hypothetical protein